MRRWRQGLAAIRGNEWVSGFAEGHGVVKVSVSDVRVEHEVKLGGFYEVAGDEGAFAAGRDAAAENTRDLGDGNTEVAKRQESISL